MKFINTLSILFFLFIAVACSSESDSVMNDIDNKNDVPTSKEVVAAFNISLTGQSIQTKTDNTENANDAESKLTNCFIAAVSENGNVLCSFTSKNPSDIKMLVKISETYQPILTFVAIANVEDQTMTSLLNSKNLSSIKGVTLTEAPGAFVKVGFSEVKEYSIDEKNKTEITIPLFQRTGAIVLESFLVDGKDAVVKSLELVNVKTNAKVEGEGTDDYITSGVLTISENDYKSARLYAYENTSETKTAIKITYTHNNVNYDRTYTIKTDGAEKILAGKLYKLNVKISSSSANIQFDVKDWIPNEIDLGTIDGTQAKK